MVLRQAFFFTSCLQHKSQFNIDAVQFKSPFSSPLSSYLIAFTHNPSYCPWPQHGFLSFLFGIDPPQPLLSHYTRPSVLAWIIPLCWSLPSYLVPWKMPQYQLLFSYSSSFLCSLISFVTSYLIFSPPSPIVHPPFLYFIFLFLCLLSSLWPVPHALRPLQPHSSRSTRSDHHSLNSGYRSLTIHVSQG